MKYLIFGANGQLGREFHMRLSSAGILVCVADRTTCDITSQSAVERMLDTHKPTVAINCAAYNLVDDAEENKAWAFSVNAEAVKTLAVCCAQRKIKLVHYSTDYVFNGRKGQPYVEADKPHPLSVYAKSKLEGEEYVQNMARDYLLFRVSWVIGSGRQNFIYKVQQWLEKTDTLRISDDEVSVPTLADTIVRVTLQAVKAELRGLYHLTNSGQASRYELTRYYLEMIGVKNKQVIPVPFSSFTLKAKRPGYSVMSNVALSRALGIVIPDWRDNLREYITVGGAKLGGSVG